MAKAPPWAAAPKAVCRLRLRLRGLVQGVGFRPHLYALALRHGLSGFVYNDQEGVLLEAQGEAHKLQAFQTALREELPPLARVDSLEAQEVPCLPGEGEGFAIMPSPEEAAAPPLLSVGPDMAPCKACLEELLCPGERRFLYAFLNCTHCGPRYTVSLHMPWERAHTALAAFPMCQACAAEYANPADRRFHAQPIACPACGPQLDRFHFDMISSLGSGSAQVMHLSALPSRNPRPPRAHVKLKPVCCVDSPAARGEDSALLKAFAACIAGGGIVALKAAGGFQLVCNAHSEAAVARLRQRKMREGKPLAIMVPNLATARRYAKLSGLEEALLCSPERPIVLVRKQEEAQSPLAPSLAPGMAHLGLCLPSTPLHYALLYEALGRPASRAWLEEAQPLAWVATSANLSGEPLAIGNEEALCSLCGIADSFALHNRPIATAMDDSVLQVAAGAPQLLRRARGYVPTPLPLPWQGPPLLAVGGQQKSTFCLVHNNRAYISQHLGALDSPKARAAFSDNIERLCALLKLKPQWLAADLHPEYFSTQWAEATGLACLGVQHHAAHVAAVWAEHPQAPSPLLGLALDGVGLGNDGLPWGGELLLLEEGGAWQRLGHLAPLPLLGGEAAAMAPWRMGVAAWLALGEEAKALEVGARHGLSASLLAAWKRGGLHAPLSTSLGRFLDAAANLLGLCEVASFEAQAPMLLEALAHREEGLPLPWPLEGFEVEADNTLNLLGLLGRLEGGRRGAALWLHEALAEALAQWAGQEARRRGLGHVALAGGCFQNRLLCEALTRKLGQRGLCPLLPRQLPPNDGGLCLGQALMATWHYGG